MPPTPCVRTLPALALTALVTVACSVPDFPGPQVQEPPTGFTMNREASLERRIFPDLDVVHHDAWVAAGWGNFSGIYINGHSGVLTEADAEAARQAVMALPTQRPEQIRDVGPLETTTIDGRAAYAWSEMVRSPTQGIEFVAYRAVVPYDTVSYAVEMISGDPKYKARPDTLRTIVASFAVGRTTYNFPLILVAAGALLLLIARMRARSQERARRHAGITLKQVPRPEKEEGDSDR